MQKEARQPKFVHALEGLLALACVLLVAVAGVEMFDAGAAIVLV